MILESSDKVTTKQIQPLLQVEMGAVAQAPTQPQRCVATYPSLPAHNLQGGRILGLYSWASHLTTLRIFSVPFPVHPSSFS